MRIERQHGSNEKAYVNIRNRGCWVLGMENQRKWKDVL